MIFLCQPVFYFNLQRLNILPKPYTTAVLCGIINVKKELTKFHVNIAPQEGGPTVQSLPKSGCVRKLPANMAYIFRQAVQRFLRVV